MIDSIIRWLESLPTLVSIYFIIGTLLALGGVGFIVAIMWSQIRKAYFASIYNTYSKTIQNEFNSLIVQSNMGTLPAASFQYKVNNLSIIRDSSPHMGQLMLDKLLALRKNVTGDTAHLISRIYEELKLKDLTLRKLNSIKWKQKAKALKELQVMAPESSEEIFIKFLSHPNKHLRRQARLGVVQVGKEPLLFLYTLNDSLLRWEQILIYQNLKSRPAQFIPDFSSWYHHSDSSIAGFAIEMTSYFGQVYNIPKLEALLPNAAHKIVPMIINSLRKMEAESALPVVIEAMKQSNDTETLCAALEFIATLGNETSIDTVRNFSSQENETIAFQATKTLKMLGHDFANASDKDQAMLAHLNHPLL